MWHISRTRAQVHGTLRRLEQLAIIKAVEQFKLFHASPRLMMGGVGPLFSTYIVHSGRVQVRKVSKSLQH